ncbi:MAG: hydroxyacid dehydrogenase [Candidatus Staskawiczbacteria bacterium]|nr:hydroxyacid dehydrogenase [Candidatus Staskawiczbacteria bacterium]
MKASFFETEDWEKEYLESQLHGIELTFSSEPLTVSNIEKAQGCAIVSPFIYSAINKEIIKKLPDVKFIATRSTGFDHIDTAFAKENKIAVSNVPFYGENTVAEHTFALILALSRKLFDSVDRARKGDFSLDGLCGFDLKEKTLGIVGMGHIGVHVARIAKGFEMNVLAFDLKQDKKLAKKIGFKYADFESVLKNSDIITLHAPYNKNTHHLINSKNINLIKKGAYLINTARGALVETEALLKALSEGILSGAGLDVLEAECFIKEEAQLLSKEFPKTCDLKTVLQNHVLLQQKNVIITPHNAFNSKEALKRILDTTILNVQAFVKNKPINLVK